MRALAIDASLAVGCDDDANEARRLRRGDRPRWSCARHGDWSRSLGDLRRCSRDGHPFKASDGVRLRGAVFGKGRIGVALAHEYAANLCNWAPYARYLAARGYRVLIFDTRCFGRSSCRRPSHVDADVTGAAAELRRRGAKQIVVGGASLGGAATLVAAAKLARPPAAVISLSSPSTDTLSRLLGRRFALDPDAAVQRLAAPTLFLASEGDDPFQGDAKTLYGISNATGKQVEIVAGNTHGTALLDPIPNPSGARLRALIVTFIRAHT